MASHAGDGSDVQPPLATVNRRAVLVGMAAAGVAGPLAAQPSSPDETIVLWPAGAPGAPRPLPVTRVEQRSSDPAFNDRWITGIGRPTLTVRRPARPNGTAMMIVPGGGYGFLSWDNEGEEQARWLTALGVTCFILSYRLPGEGWSGRATVPLADAQRGLRLIRSRTARYGIDPRRVAVLGFSAGGHLAGSLAARADEKTYAPIDAADRLSARPDLAGLVYPVVSMAAPFTHAGSRDALLGQDATAAARATASVETRVTARTPPMFLVHASDDGLVPIQNSLALYGEMVAKRRPAELHAFDQGGHGFGVRLPKSVPASAWPGLFAAYARRHGVLA